VATSCGRVEIWLMVSFPVNMTCMSYGGINREFFYQMARIRICFYSLGKCPSRSDHDYW
jgi:hypothetical protein